MSRKAEAPTLSRTPAPDGDVCVSKGRGPEPLHRKSVRTPANKERRCYPQTLTEVQPVFWEPSLLLGEPFYRLTRELDATCWFVSYDPGIVPRRDDIGVARTYLHLRAIVHNDL